MKSHPSCRAWLAGILLLAGCEAAVPPTATAAPARPEGVLAIGQVQGTGPLSPVEGQVVTVEGVVTGAFSRGLGGFFIQDAGDGDPRTSDGLFVIAGKDSPVPRDLAAGDRVRIEGRVVEQAGQSDNTPSELSLTALVPIQVRTLGPGELPLQVLAGPPDAAGGWEALEGMRVRIDGPVTVGGTGQLSRYGEVSASLGERLWQPSERAAPGSPAFDALRADNARRRIVVDDASNQRNPRRIWYLPEAANDPDADPSAGDRPTGIGLRAGTVLRGVEAIVDQRHGAYRLQLVGRPEVELASRPAPPQVPGRRHVAVFNLQNLFNGDGRGGGFPTARGARDADEWRVQQAKLVDTLHALDPDIAALMELENDGFGPDSSIAHLTAALNEAAAGQAAPDHGVRWRFIDAGQGPGRDAIRVGLLYRSDRVAPQGAPATLEDGPFGRNSRVPLAQTFVSLDEAGRQGTPFTVVANHFKSKGCGEAQGRDADSGDGTGCWHAVRTESARRLDAWMATDPTRSGSDLVLLVGDFNSYAMETPLQYLQSRGWQDALAGVDEQDRYSYIFDGMAGRLDHALASPSMAKRLTGAAIWHCNTDEPGDAGYRGRGVPGPWRSSDHDPMLLGFDL